MFALAIQGGGFALLYLAVYFALARYGFIGPAPAFLLFAVLGVACAVCAARQASQVLALLGLSGAFVAPMLASSGSGQYVVLFSYYLLLDAFIIALSWQRAWRALIFAGFLFTFAIGAGWGLRSYVPADYLTVQAFLIAFFVLFTATHVAQTVLRAPGAAGWQSGSLLFGPPLAAGMSACRSEKASTRSGSTARMRSSLPDENPLIFGFSRRASGGRTVKPEMPAMRSASPSAYSTSTASVHRQAMRCGQGSPCSSPALICGLPSGAPVPAVRTASARRRGCAACAAAGFPAE